MYILTLCKVLLFPRFVVAHVTARRRLAHSDMAETLEFEAGKGKVIPVQAVEALRVAGG
jgi:hypothetical protein